MGLFILVTVAVLQLQYILKIISLTLDLQGLFRNIFHLMSHYLTKEVIKGVSIIETQDIL